MKAIAYIEATDIDSSGNTTYFPEFTTHVWPFLIKHSDYIENIIMVENLSHPERVQEFGTFHELSKKTLKLIEHRSFFGGHLNVYYKVRIDSPMVREFVQMWPDLELRMSLEEFFHENTVGMTKFIESRITDDNVGLIAFCHDGSPMCVFGLTEKIEALSVSVGMLHNTK